ncbi:MAG: hypothetical protein ABI212_15515 [Burkholderiaceae bacterium]
MTATFWSSAGERVGFQVELATVSDLIHTEARIAHYDLIGTGPGGAALTQRLAPTGKRILLLERDDYLPRTGKNWSSQAVFVDGTY